MEDFVIKETDKSEVSVDNSNNLIVIVSETGLEQPTELDDQFKNVKISYSKNPLIKPRRETC